MAEDTEAERLDTIEEEEGGPVKSFLEHLEDLRWVLIKSLSAAGVAMIACFFAGNLVFKVLLFPLQKAPIGKSGKGQIVKIVLGTNQLGVFHIATNEALATLAGTNHYIRLSIVPIT